MEGLYTPQPERTVVTIEGETPLAKVRITIEAACIEDATHCLKRLGVDELLLGRRALADARVGELLELEGETQTGEPVGPSGPVPIQSGASPTPASPPAPPPHRRGRRHAG